MAISQDYRWIKKISLKCYVFKSPLLSLNKYKTKEEYFKKNDVISKKFGGSYKILRPFSDAKKLNTYLEL